MRHSEMPRTSKGTVTIAPGFRLYREVICRAEDYHGLDVDVTVTWSDELSRLTASRIDVRQREGGHPVTAELLRSVAVQAFIRHAVMASVRDGLTPGGQADEEPRRSFGLIRSSVAAECRAAGPTPDTLKWVALIYRAALATGEPPTKAVRETFEVSQSTAGAWVAAARKAGELAQAEGPGKASV